MTKKRTYTFPDKIFDKLQQEAKRRILELNMAGQITSGSMERDIICLALHIALKQIKQIPKHQFKQEIKKAKTKS